MPIRPPLPSIDYTSRDWSSIRDSIISHLRRRFPNDWTDFSESSLGIALIEVVSYAFEVLSFSLDRAVNENFLTTATERQSVIKLASLLGYKLASSTAASATLIIQPDELLKHDSPIFIAGGTKISAGDVVFEIDRDYTVVRYPNSNHWSTNGGPVTSIAILGAVQGQTVSDSFTSAGTKFQTFKSSSNPYIDKSSLVQVDGIDWVEVDSLVIGDVDNPTDQNIYEVVLDKDDRLSVRFGDGITGNIPSEGAAIQIFQRVGGGERGNVADAALNSTVACTSNGVVSSVKVTGSGPASGGTDRETTEHAKVYAPMWGRTTDRAITYNDYLALCSGYSDGRSGRIAKAGIIAQPSDGLSNTVTIYVWTETTAGELAPAPEPLKRSLLEFLNNRKVITVNISPIQDGDNVPIDLDLLLSVYPGFNHEDVVRQVGVALNTLFASNNVRFENELRLSWVHDYLLAVPGIKSVNIRQPSPSTIAVVTEGIDPGVLPVQTGALPNQIVITAPADRGVNFYVNYSVVIAYSPTSEKKIRRVLASTAATTGNPCYLTLSESATAFALVGVGYTFQHPRRIKISDPGITSASEITNRRLVLHQPIGGIEDVERSIVDYDMDERIILVNKDFLSNPVDGTPVVITPDYLAPQTRAFTLGSVATEIEDAF